MAISRDFLRYAFSFAMALAASSPFPSELHRQPEVETVRRAQRGDERAFSSLVRAYKTPVFNFVLRMVRDRALAEDVTQEVFLRVFQALPKFSHRSKFSTWLFQVTKHQVLDELRARDRRISDLVELDDFPSLQVVDAPPEQGETVAAIWLAIEELPTDLKMALLLRDVVGLSYAEISDALEINATTVKWRIFNARKQVTLALTRADVAVSGLHSR